MNQGIVLSLLAFLIVPFTARAQWTVTRLNPVPNTGSMGAGAYGDLQVGMSDQGVWRACLWNGSSQSWVSLHPAGTTYSFAFAAGDGVQVGYAGAGFLGIGNQSHASLWTGSASSWIDLNPPISEQSVAYAVSGGEQVGYVQSTVLGQHASLWRGSAASWVDLNPPGTRESVAHAAGNGQQGGYAYFGTSQHAVLWSGTAASWIDLHPFIATNSLIQAIDGTRQFGVASVNGESHASMWTGTAASWVDLHPVGSWRSSILGAALGLQVGYLQWQTTGAPRATLWSGSAESMVDLHAFLPTDFVYSYAAAITRDGNKTYIIGYGLSATTVREEALLWTRVDQSECAADFNSDYVVNFFDYLDFVEAFSNSSSNADFNHNAIVDFFDYLDFVDAFSTGC